MNFEQILTEINDSQEFGAQLLRRLGADSTSQPGSRGKTKMLLDFIATRVEAMQLAEGNLILELNAAMADAEAEREDEDRYYLGLYSAFRAAYEIAENTLGSNGAALVTQLKSQLAEVGRLEAENKRLVLRVAELERKLGEQNTELMKQDVEIARLQSQLAWTPLSAGMPTDPGAYEFRSHALGIRVFTRQGDRWALAGTDEAYAAHELRAHYSAYRRIELPEGV